MTDDEKIEALRVATARYYENVSTPQSAASGHVMFLAATAALAAIDCLRADRDAWRARAEKAEASHGAKTMTLPTAITDAIDAYGLAAGQDYWQRNEGYRDDHIAEARAAHDTARAVLLAAISAHVAAERAAAGANHG